LAQQGWVKEQRKEMDSLIWANPYQFKLWRQLIMLANHSDGKVIFNGKEFVVSSGQLVTGRDALAFIYNKGAQPVHQKSARLLWKWLKKFEEWQMLTIKSTTKYSVITITNYGKYQQGDQLQSSKSPARVQLESTNKNDKNEEKDKKKDKSLLLLDENLIQETWENNGFGFLAPKTNQDFEYWIEDFQQLGSTKKDAVELITRAIDIAVDANARNYGYVKAILQNWKTLELTTTEMVDVNAKQRSAKSKPKSKQKKPYQNFEQNDDQYDDLPF